MNPPPSHLALSRAARAVAQDLRVLETLCGGDAYRAECAEGRIGAHIRHVVEFFRCFLQQGPSGRVDYDARARDQALEGCATTAARAMEEAAERIGAGALAAMPATLVMVESLPGTGPVETPSTPEREAAFCISHAIHHLALPKTLARRRGVTLPDAFGVAASTLRARAA